MYPEPLIDIEQQRMDLMFAINLFTPIAGCRAAFKAMRQHGQPAQLINICSLASQEDKYGGYGVTKSALEHAGRCLRRELEEDDIRITIIAPGAFVSNLGRDFLQETQQKLQDNIVSTGVKLDGPEANRVFGDPDRIAELISHILKQPIDLNISYVTIQPAKALEI